MVIFPCSFAVQKRCKCIILRDGLIGVIVAIGRNHTHHVAIDCTFRLGLNIDIAVRKKGTIAKFIRALVCRMVIGTLELHLLSQE